MPFGIVPCAAVAHQIPPYIHWAALYPRTNCFLLSCLWRHKVPRQTILSFIYHPPSTDMQGYILTFREAQSGRGCRSSLFKWHDAEIRLHASPWPPPCSTAIPAATRRIWIVIFLFLYLVILNFSLHVMIRQPYCTLFCISCHFLILVIISKLVWTGVSSIKTYYSNPISCCLSSFFWSQMTTWFLSECSLICVSAKKISLGLI